MRALRETKTHILFLLLSCSILLIRVCQGFSLPARITGARPKGATRLDTGISKHALLPRAGSSTGQETVVTEAVNGSHNKPQHAPSPQKDSEEGGDGLDEIDDHERELLYGETLLNGEKSFLQEIFEKLRKVNIRKKDLMPDAPPLTFNKFLTMQQKRVVVTFRYTGKR